MGKGAENIPAGATLPKAKEIAPDALFLRMVTLLRLPLISFYWHLLYLLW
jgi:hypothetical protein